jgi:hypothetical protein
MIRSFCKWLAATTLSTTLGGAVWVVPLVQTIHLLLIAVVMASALLLTARLVGVTGRDLTLAEAAQRFAAALWPALSGLALSGAIESAEKAPVLISRNEMPMGDGYFLCPGHS